MYCRVCHSASATDEIVFTLHNRKFGLDVDFLFCELCENYYCSDIQMNKRAHDETYSDNHAWSKITEEDWNRHYSLRENRQKKLNRKIFKQISKALDLRSLKHADFACAEGVLVETMIEHGVNSIGIEIDRNAVQWGKKKGRPLFNESLFETAKKDFDFISIHEALDHMPSVFDALKAIKKSLREGGHISIVNTIYDMKHEIQKNKFHHSTYFSLKGLRTSLGLHGFEIIQETRLPLPGRWPQRLRNPRFKSKHLVLARLKAV